MSQPNILFLFPDQHRPDWLGANPDLPLRTPNLDRICETGMRFTNCVTPSPVCAPARAALAAGKSYATCGVIDNGQAYPLSQPTFYQALRDAGYRVAGVGKFDLDKPDLNWNLDGSRTIREWGFTEGIDNEGKFDGSTSFRCSGEPCGPYLKALADGGLAEAYVEEHANCTNYMGAYTTVVPEELYCDNWLSENGLRYLREFPAEQPWFMQVNFTGPHNPMDVTSRMRARWENESFPDPHNNDHADREGLLRNRQNYAAMIENIDRQVGRFLDAVRERGELENTLIVYSSDHGEMLGDHARWGKSNWHWPSAGVPLIISGPGVQKGVVSPALVNLYDLAATFVEAANAVPMPEMDALGLGELLTGEKEKHRDVLVSGLRNWQSAFDGQHKLVVVEDKEDCLYDTAADPWEDVNVIDQHADVAARLRTALD